MSRQIQICFSHEDNREFEKAAQVELGAVLIPYRNNSSQPEQVDSLVTSIESGSRTDGHLMRWPDLRSLRMRSVPTQNYWSVDQLRSPVVEFDGGFEKDHFIRCGRLYVITGFYEGDGRWVARPKDFLDWADRVMKLAKRLSRRDPESHVYVGKSARDKKTRGWELVAAHDTRNL